MSSTKPTILIVGASFGGLGTARQLCQNGGTEKFNIILVAQNELFTIGGLWQFVWTDRLDMDQIVFPLQDASMPGIDMRLGQTVLKWNTTKKQIVLKDGLPIPYDYIVMASGVVPDPTPIPGIQAHVNICSFDTVPRQQEEAHDLLQKARNGEKVTFVLAIGDTPYKCPPAPFELTFMLDEMLSNVRDHVRMVITCPIDWPMPHPQSKDMFIKELSSRNIEYLPSHVIQKIENDTIHYTNGVTIEATLLWTVYPIRAPDFVQDAIPTNEEGTISVDSVGTISNIENAYAIGDCSSVAFEEHTLPKAGEFAWKMGVRVADAIVSDSTPRADLIGACVAEIGHGKGIALKSDFSDGSPDFEVSESSLHGEKEKVDWVNLYLKRIFGDKASTLELSSESKGRKRQRIE